MHFIQPSTNLHLDIFLPLGISFYTFEAISYVVDVYRRQTKPAEHYWDYVLFVIYFPHLIAGPIMRAKSFLPQVIKPREITLNKFYEGSYLFFWGLFEKIFVADNLAKIVNPVFAANSSYHGEEVLVALYAFAFQIFCDFDGYSNMARGLGKMMGFEIAINFNLPYFASNPREFWQRWHITLSSWLRDYLYIPLGGNQTGAWKTYRNLLITMLLGGLWHGASWTFVIWGLYHGILLCVHRFASAHFKNERSTQASNAVNTILFFHLIVIGWLFFRAQSIPQAIAMLGSFNNFNVHAFLILFAPFICIVLPLLIVQLVQFKANDLMVVFKQPKFVKIAIYAFLTYLILGHGVMQAEEFIYFQF